MFSNMIFKINSTEKFYIIKPTSVSKQNKAVLVGTSIIVSFFFFYKWIFKKTSN